MVVTWTSDNTSVATIDATGLATGVGVGTTVITASLDGVTSPGVTLTVTAVTTVEINSGDVIILGVDEVVPIEYTCITLPYPPYDEICLVTGGIPIDVKDIVVSENATGLAAFDFTLNWDASVIQVDDLLGSAASGGQEWGFTIGDIDNVAGTVSFVGTTTKEPYSAADLTLAYLGITAVGNAEDSTSINVTITNLTDNKFTEISPRTPVNAPVMIVSLMAETSASQAKDSDGVVVVTVTINRAKDLSTGLTAEIPGGIGSYAATVTAVPGGGIEFLNVRGVSPFDTVTFNPATGEFAVSSVSSPPQAANTTVAKVVPKLIGNCLTSYDLNVAFTSIGAAGQPGLNVPEEHSNSITVLRGDADNNGSISIVDSLALKQYLVGQLVLSQINPINAASPNHDGTGGDKISVVDALAIEQYLVGQLNAYFE